MTAKHFLLLFLFYFIGSIFAEPIFAEEKRLHILLDELDKTIKDKDIFHHSKKKKLDSLRISLIEKSDQEIFEIYKELYSENLHFETDSAVYYADLMMELPYVKKDKSLTNETKIRLAEVYGLMGMYVVALDELMTIDLSVLNENQLNYYFHTSRAIYGWLAEFSSTSNFKLKYKREMYRFRDSILEKENDKLNHAIVYADKLNSEGEPTRALKLMQSFLPVAKSRNKVYVYYNMADSYHRLGDVENEKRLLAMTAICDIKNGVREYVALPELSYLLFTSGDITRSYNYLTCAMNDASKCKAGLRTVEIARMFPIIDATYKQQMKIKDHLHTLIIVVGALFSLFLIALAVYLKRQMDDLSKARKAIVQTNLQLKESNKALLQTGQIKEEYIARYLNICRDYLDKIEGYRRSLVKLARASRTEELFKMLKSKNFIQEETASFYREFDESFLILFPNFIDDFNNLLVEDGKLQPKRGELMNTELRIFALIRLGIADSTQISHFLGYSLTTIYNYRSKIRNKSKGDKNKFEDEVMKIN